MSNFRTVYYLTKVEGLGPVRIKKLLETFKCPDAVFDAPAKELIQVEGISEKIIRSIRAVSKNREKFDGYLDKIEKRMDSLKIGVLTYADGDYPDLLKKIFDPPVILYFRGEKADTIFNKLDRSIGIVGTRNPTQYGKDIAERIASGLCSKGMNIISGFARGIDTMAHKAVLAHESDDSFTAAVLGCGIDVIYPPENKKLFDKMIQSGLILSECELGAIPDSANFPRRNRIISGLSLGVIIIESAPEGGALITARCALDQSREVFAVPGDINSKYSKGTNNLIKNGQAKLISDVDDVLVEFKGKLKNLTLFGENGFEGGFRQKVELKGNEKCIFDYLCSVSELAHIDEISESTGLQISDCLVGLLNLEFKGLIRQSAGKMFSVIN
ncbi:MAG: DNA-processing protein DprA [Ignavibacteria bacterium]